MGDEDTSQMTKSAQEYPPELEQGPACDLSPGPSRCSKVAASSQPALVNCAHLYPSWRGGGELQLCPPRMGRRMGGVRGARSPSPPQHVDRRASCRRQWPGPPTPAGLPGTGLEEPGPRPQPQRGLLAPLPASAGGPCLPPDCLFVAEASHAPASCQVAPGSTGQIRPRPQDQGL